MTQINRWFDLMMTKNPFFVVGFGLTVGIFLVWFAFQAIDNYLHEDVFYEVKITADKNSVRFGRSFALLLSTPDANRRGHGFGMTVFAGKTSVETFKSRKSRFMSEMYAYLHTVGPYKVEINTRYGKRKCRSFVYVVETNNESEFQVRTC
jgi:hypothetical protein